MAEAAPRVRQVPGGLIYYEASSRRQLAKAALVSLVVHAVLLGADAFPELAPPMRVAVESQRLAGELRPAPDFVGRGSADPSSPRPRIMPKKRGVTAVKRESVPPVTAGRHPPPLMPPEASEPVSAASLSAYRLAVARQARQFKPDSPATRSTGATVEVRVSIHIMPGAAWPVVRLQRSSGRSQFDEAALAMIGQSVRQAPLPAELQGRRLQLELPVLFAPDG